MNERVPDSNGLPLRAMVMVLLFLGVVFLLLGFQAAGSSSGDDEDASAASSETTSVTTSARAAAESSAESAPADPIDVYVYNISEVEGAADRVATQLRDSEVEVKETGNLPPEIAPVTTVFYPEGDEDRALAERIGGILGAPIEVRGPNLAEQPPGVVVVVTG